MMKSTGPELLDIDVDETTRVSALLIRPQGAIACLVLAHGAGAGMDHRFMATLSDDLAARDVATLRYQFPYMQRKSRRPDRPALCHATVRAAVTKAAQLVPTLPLIAGGKSFGGRMTSQAQAGQPLQRVRGLVFFGFPLHPSKQPSVARGEHLADISIPMLFLQGARDDLCDLPRLRQVIEPLGPLATLRAIEHADHSFHVPARSGTSDAQVMNEMLTCLLRWIREDLLHDSSVIVARPPV